MSIGLGPVYIVISTRYAWVGPKPSNESVVIRFEYDTLCSLPSLLPGCGYGTAAHHAAAVPAATVTAAEGQRGPRKAPALSAAVARTRGWAVPAGRASANASNAAAAAAAAAAAVPAAAVPTAAVPTAAAAAAPISAGATAAQPIAFG